MESAQTRYAQDSGLILPEPAAAPNSDPSIPFAAQCFTRPPVVTAKFSQPSPRRSPPVSVHSQPSLASTPIQEPIHYVSSSSNDASSSPVASISDSSTGRKRRKDEVEARAGQDEDGGNPPWWLGVRTPEQQRAAARREANKLHQRALRQRKGALALRNLEDKVVSLQEQLLEAQRGRASVEGALAQRSRELAERALDLDWQERTLQDRANTRELAGSTQVTDTRQHLEGGAGRLDTEGHQPSELYQTSATANPLQHQLIQYLHRNLSLSLTQIALLRQQNSAYEAKNTFLQKENGRLRQAAEMSENAARQAIKASRGSSS